MFAGGRVAYSQACIHAVSPNLPRRPNTACILLCGYGLLPCCTGYVLQALYTAGRDELSANIKSQLNSQLNPRGIEVEQALLRKVVLPVSGTRTWLLTTLLPGYAACSFRLLHDNTTDGGDGGR